MANGSNLNTKMLPPKLQTLLFIFSLQIVTLKGVVSEIRDRATRQRLQDRLQLMPHDIQFREPNAEDLHHGELHDEW